MRRVLVAEDHQGIAETYKLMLESKKTYDVVLTQNGEECIEKYERYYFESRSNDVQQNVGCSGQGAESIGIGRVSACFSALSGRNDNDIPFDLVVLDYHLPQKDGIDVAKHILSMVPHQRILIASSYPRENIVRSAETLDRSVELLLKPFDLEDFADAVEGLKHAETIGGKMHWELEQATANNPRVNNSKERTPSKQQQDLLALGEK